MTTDTIIETEELLPVSHLAIDPDVSAGGRPPSGPTTWRARCSRTRSTDSV